MLTGGTANISGSLTVTSELENDGTLRALSGGTLTQYNEVASPATSSGVFVADSTGVLSVSNVLMGSGSTASGTGAIRFANGRSLVVAGATYAAGITDRPPEEEG